MKCCYFYRGARCSKCASKKSNAGRFVTINTFDTNKDAVEWFDKEKNMLPINKYPSSGNTKVWLKCPKGHSISMRCGHFKRGSRCAECRTDGYSKECIEWLECIERKYNIRIQHAEKPGKEFPIPTTRYKADGWVKIDDKEYIFEYHGYRWHGLKGLEKQDELNPYKDKTNAQAYADTIKKENKIKQLGYTLIVIWSDDYLLNRDNYISGNFNITELEK
jgi:hypothetical protein